MSEKRRAAFRKWAAENKDYQRQRFKDWYEKNKERVRLRKLSQYPKLREHLCRRAREWYQRNGKTPEFQERNRQRVQKYLADHPEKKIEAQHIRRARVKGASVKRHGVSAWIKQIRLRCFVPCSYCGVFIDPRRGHFDHIVPLSRGGEHSLGNICLACTDCNLSKGARLLSEWKPVYS